MTGRTDEIPGGVVAAAESSGAVFQGPLNRVEGCVIILVPDRHRYSRALRMQGHESGGKAFFTGTVATAVTWGDG